MPTQYLWLKLQVGTNFAVLNIFFIGYSQRSPSTKENSNIKVDIWKPYCGLEVYKPTQALQSVKGPVNTFDWNPKWVRHLPSLIYFNGICIGIPLQKIKFKYQSWYLTPYYGIEVQKPTQALQSVKFPPNTFDWNSKWVRTLPSLIYFS
jgi:hypothetical protein